MSSVSDKLEEFVTSTLPKSLVEFDSMHKNINPISDYCRDAYATGDRRQVYTETVNYSRDVVTNVAFHTNTLASQLTQFLELQAQEVERLDVTLKVVTERLRALHENTGISGYRSAAAVRDLPRQENKLVKVDAAALPETSMELPQWQRTAIDYSKVEGYSYAFEAALSSRQVAGSRSARYLNAPQTQ